MRDSDCEFALASAGVWQYTHVEVCNNIIKKETTVAKNKQKKQKERERRVAKEKLEAVAQRRSEEKAAGENKKPLSRPAKVMTSVALPETHNLGATQKNFMHRRTGG